MKLTNFRRILRYNRSPNLIQMIGPGDSQEKKENLSNSELSHPGRPQSEN